MDYKLELLLSFIKILPPVLLISFTSLFFIKLLKITNFIEKLLILFLFNWIQIIIGIEILSIFKIISYLPLIIFHIISALICLIFFIKKKMRFHLSFFEIKSNFLNFYKNLNLNKVLKILLILWLLVIVFVPFLIGVSVPPGNYDSMTYHLARAGFWKQYQSLNHYSTSVGFQNENPINAEVGLLWNLIFTNSSNITFLSQWIAFIIILLTLYKILRKLGYSSNVSFISVFTFATFDIIILEAYTTQNDLIVASFICLTLFLLIKVFESEEINLKYIILAGFAAGIAIGTKGYSYLFIPGFVLFIILYSRNKKIKYKKISYFLLFSILGILLFSAYNFIQNYLSYNNVFSSSDRINLMRIYEPNFIIFISNFSKHIASFYQYYNNDHGTVGTIIQKAVDGIHWKLQIDISSPATTWPGYFFYYSGLKLNYDESYFGPICFFFILPSVFFNTILAVCLCIWEKGQKSIRKYVNHLIILIIPALFFIGYVLIFKWQPYTGRLMIAFILLMMVGFAESLDLLKTIRWKYFFPVIITILVSVSLVFSSLPLFFNNYQKLVSLKGESFYNSKYEDRRGAFGNNAKVLVDETLGEKSKLGIIFKEGDWVFIFFGTNFERQLEYISNNEWNNKSLEKIMKDNNLDGLLVNTKVEQFENGTLKSYTEKMIGKSLLKITPLNFKKYFQPLSGCDFINPGENIIVKVYNDDPYFETKFPLKFGKEKNIILNIAFSAEEQAVGQIFYARENKNYNEQDSIRYNIKKGENDIYIPIDNVDQIVKIRIDPTNIKKDCTIKKIEFYSLSDIKYKSVDEYILFY